MARSSDAGRWHWTHCAVFLGSRAMNCSSTARSMNCSTPPSPANSHLRQASRSWWAIAKGRRSPPAPAIGSAGGTARGSGRPAGGWLASGRRRPGGSELAAAAPPTAPPRLAGGWGALASPSGPTHMPLRSSRRDRGMPPGRPAAPSSVPACGWAGPGLLESPQPEPPGPSSSGTARGAPAGSGRGDRIAFPGPPSCPAALDGVPGGVPQATGWHPQMANPSVRTWWQRRSGFLPGFRHQCNKVRKKEGSGQDWLVKTRVIYCTQINLNRCALCASSVHQLSRLSQYSLSVFVLAVSHTQTMRPSLHSVSLRIPAPRWLYLVSPRQLLQSDTGVPHFALDPLTYRCLLRLFRAADFAEPRPPRHNMIFTIDNCTQYTIHTFP